MWSLLINNTVPHFQAAETQAPLQSLQDELQDQRQKNSDLMKLCEQKDSDVSSVLVKQFVFSSLLMLQLMVRKISSTAAESVTGASVHERPDSWSSELCRGEGEAAVCCCISHCRERSAQDGHAGKRGDGEFSCDHFVCCVEPLLFVFVTACQKKTIFFSLNR